VIRIEPATLTVRILDGTGRQLGTHTIGPDR